MVVVSALLAFAASCGGGESAPEQANEAAPTTVVSPDGGDASPTSAATASPTVGSEPAAEPTSPVPAFVGEWPNRFCVSGVDSTLNLRAAPSTDAEILASIPRSSCNIVSGGTDLDDNFQPVIYTTVDGAVDGWVSNNFISFQDPPDRIESAVLLFVEAWQLGLDTTQYSFGLDELPPPIRQGHPVLVEIDSEPGVGGGCELVGDITIDCVVQLVERDGTLIARSCCRAAAARHEMGTTANRTSKPIFPTARPSPASPYSQTDGIDKPMPRRPVSYMVELWS